MDEEKKDTQGIVTPQIELLDPNKESEKAKEAYTPAIGTMKDMIGQLEKKKNRYREFSQEDEEKLKRKQRTSEIISSVGDVARALSNLAYTTKGAPNMYDPKTPMSDKMRERYEKILAERRIEGNEHDKRESAVNEIKLKLAALQQDQQNAGIKAALAAYKTNQERMVQGERAKREAAGARSANANADLAEKKVNNYDQEAQDKHAVAQSVISRNNAQANKARSGGGGRSPKANYRGLRGDEYLTGKAYDTRVIRDAQAINEYLKSINKGNNAIELSTTDILKGVKPRKTSAIAAEVEAWVSHNPEAAEEIIRNTKSIKLGVSGNGNADNDNVVG